MTREEEYDDDLRPIDVWLTPNVAMYRQLTMWDAKKKEFYFVPATTVGYVVVTAHQAILGCPPTKAFSLYKPAGMSLSWYFDKTINIRVMSIEEAKSWKRQDRSVWEDVLAFNGITW